MCGLFCGGVRVGGSEGQENWFGLGRMVYMHITVCKT